MTPGLGRWLLAFSLITALFGHGAHAQGVRSGQEYRVVLTAAPTHLPADGQSIARVTAQVRTWDGQDAPDGTEVYFTTDLGDLSTTGVVGRRETVAAVVSGGFSTVELSSDEAGTATVRADCRGSSDAVMVDFGGGGAESPVLRIEGGWVGYAQQDDFIEARTKASLTYRGLEVHAEVIQLSVQDLIVRADAVVLRRGDKQLEGEDAYLELGSMRGVLRRFGDEGVERVAFSATSLEPREEEAEVPEGAFRLIEAEPTIWQVCRRAALYPREKLVLQNASLYVNNQRILRYPPFWVVGFAGYTGSSNTSFVSVNTNGGLSVDFPFFFSVTDGTSDAVRVQHGARYSAGEARRGWSLGLEHSYQSRGSDAEGSLLFDGLPRSDWGVSFTHSQRVFGTGRASVSVLWPDHENLMMDVSAYQSSRVGSLSVRASVDRLQSVPGWGYATGADFLTRPVPLGRSGAALRFGSGVTYGATSLAATGATLTHHTSAYLSAPAWPLGGLRITPSLAETFSWNTNQETINSVRGELALRQPLGRTGSLGLRYTAEYASGWSSVLFDEGFHQQLSMNFSAAAGDRFDTYLNATYDLTDSNVYAYGHLGFRPWHKIRLGAVGTYYDYGDFAFDDLELSVTRQVGDRELGVAWTKSNQRLSLVFGTTWY